MVTLHGRAYLFLRSKSSTNCVSIDNVACVHERGFESYSLCVGQFDGENEVSTDVRHGFFSVLQV